MIAARPITRFHHPPRRTGREQSPQLPKLLNSRVVAREPGGAFELDDEWVERAVLMVRRAKVAKARKPLPPGPPLRRSETASACSGGPSQLISPLYRARSCEFHAGCMGGCLGELRATLAGVRQEW
jgi:hypothetical protein